jgi:ribonuclease BN (tRNA processing enzyme)
VPLQEENHSVRITVLGKSPAWQDAGGACSGYLLEEQGGTCMLLDCGNGVFGKLRAVREYECVDTVLITHMHADHFVDLVPFAIALIYAPRQQPEPVGRWPGTDSPSRPRLLVPEGGQDTLRKLGALWGQEDLIDRAFDVREYAPDDIVDVGPLRVRFQRVSHWIATFAVDVSSTANGSGRFTYGADTAPDTGLVEFARGTDLLMMEATLARPERVSPRGHLTAAEAGEHARLAGARQLVLTHISDELDDELARRQAAGEFDGPVTVATEGAVYTV